MRRRQLPYPSSTSPSLVDWVLHQLIDSRWWLSILLYWHSVPKGMWGHTASVFRHLIYRIWGGGRKRKDLLPTHQRQLSCNFESGIVVGRAPMVQTVFLMAEGSHHVNTPMENPYLWHGRSVNISPFTKFVGGIKGSPKLYWLLWSFRNKDPVTFHDGKWKEERVCGSISGCGTSIVTKSFQLLFQRNHSWASLCGSPISLSPNSDSG